MSSPYDAVVVGAGPNGLAAAVALAREGHSVLVLEAADTPGGGARCAELTRPGFVHDVCSAVHPMALASPFFRTLPLADHGLEWVQPPAPVAHPLDDGTAAVQERSVAETAQAMGKNEGQGVADGVLIRQRPTQQELANLVGACRETVSRIVSDLTRRGLLSPQGRGLLISNRLTEGNA